MGCQGGIETDNTVIYRTTLLMESERLREGRMLRGAYCYVSNFFRMLGTIIARRFCVSSRDDYRS
jgi:hypothetical protein